MELQVEQESMNVKDKLKSHVRAVDWLEIVYLILFVAFVMKKYLESTALEWELPLWYDTVVRGGIHAYILVRIYEQAVVKKAMNWKEVALMAAMIFTGEMVTLYTGEIVISDTLLLIIGAKGVDFKKICFVYLCVAVSIQLTALYLVNGGYVPDYTYGTGDRIRHSLGMAYPTDFAAHVLFIVMVYVCFREKRLSFFEIALMFAMALKVYSLTYARNDAICMMAICVLCAVIRLLGYKAIDITKYKALDRLSLLVIVLFIGCVAATVFYNRDSAFMSKLNGVFSNRLQLGLTGYKQYGIHPFGTVVAEGGLGYGSIAATGFYFFLDSSYVRIILKYGYVFASIVSMLFVWIFRKARSQRKEYMVAVLAVMLLFAIMEHHFFDLAFNPLWLVAFSALSRKKAM